MVLTGGASLLPGIRELANKVLGVPVRVAKPQNLVGMADRLESPAFATSVGLLRWALNMSDYSSFVGNKIGGNISAGGETIWDRMKRFFKLLMP
jgi:cell division protein FtsA